MSRLSVCSSCGMEFNQDLAKAETNRIYGRGKYEWICDIIGGGKLCFSCATDGLYLENEDGEEVPPENIIYP